MKTKLKPHTIRKAAITGEQLQRRYAVLLDPAQPSINVLSAARWYSQQDAVVRTALDNAQPLTWLKHLLEKRGASSVRLPWHVTAVTLEEFAKATNPPLQPIPEEGVIPDALVSAISPLGNSATSSGSKSTSKSPSSRSWSLTLPPQALEPSLSRKRAETFDDTISFEPQVDSGRSSAGGDSRRSSLDVMHNRRGSLAYGMSDSAGSPFRNSVVNNYGMSPSSSRMNFRDIASRMRRRQFEKSEEALSSAHNSLSEQSHEEASPTKGNKRPPPTSFQSPKLGEGSSDADDSHLVVGQGPLSENGPLTARQGATFHAADPTVTTLSPGDVSPEPRTPASSPAKPQRVNRFQYRRLSLPSLNQLLMHEQEKRQMQADEEQERREYENKARYVMLSFSCTVA